MKKVWLLAILSGSLLACGPTTGNKGANDDGTEDADTNSAFRNDTMTQRNAATDTGIGEDRVDIQKRDSEK